MWQDFRYAVRSLAAKPAFSAIVVLSLAIGIGANSAIFSVVNALLLNPLPYPEPQRLVNIWIHSPGIGILRDWPSPGQFDDLRRENHSFQEISISHAGPMTLTGRERAELVDGMQTSSALFHLLGAKPLLGRLLLTEDDTSGKRIAVISYPLWQRLYSSDAHVLGKTIVLNGNAFTVVGVLTREFSIDSETMPTESPAGKLDVFTPLTLDAKFLGRRGDENFNLMARLKPGVAISQAQADVDIIARRIREKDKRDRTFGMSVTGLLDQVVGDVRRTLLVLLASVALVLLIACANVANLLLTRAAGRQREMAVRGALGAGMRRLTRQLLTESILLASLGGIAGIALAEGALYALRALNPGNIPRFDEIHINAPVVAFTFGISLVTGILFGLAPAWNAIQLDLSSALKTGGREGHAGGLRFSKHRLRSVLIVSEVAFSLMLLIGAGLLIRSFLRLADVPPGFSPDHVISMHVVANGPRFRDHAARLQLFQQIGDRIRRLPGVKSFGLASPLPLTGEIGWGGINVQGYTPEPGHELQVDQRTADADYFSTMEIPLVQGRFFSDHDNAQSQRVVIIDRKFAQRFWPAGDAIGKHLLYDPKEQFEIVGVVGAVKQYGLDIDGKIAIYFPQEQAANGAMYAVARTFTDPAAMANPIVAQIHAIDPNVLVYEIRTMQDRLYDSLARQRFAGALLACFAAFATILAALGLYGVLSYLVAENTHEIGIRVALGASRGSILRLVVRQGLSIAGIGIAAGLTGAAALTRLMGTLLFGVSPLDWVTFASLAGALALVAFAATTIPARRALAVDPTVALRGE